MSQTIDQTAELAAADIKAQIANLSECTGPKLCEIHNVFAHLLGIKEVSRFKTRSVGIRRTTELLTRVLARVEATERAEKGRAAGLSEEEIRKRAKRSSGQARAWANPKTRAARSSRWGMHVVGHGVDRKFRSCEKAFRALGLKLCRMQYVRKLAIQNGAQPYAGYVFTRISPDECTE